MTTSSGRTVILTMVVAFVALVMAVLLGSPALAANEFIVPQPPADQDEPTPTATATPFCNVERTQATYAQFGQGLVITPTVQFDVDLGGMTQWVTNWRVEGPVGAVITVGISLFHCRGDISTLTYCAADRAAFTTTHVLSFTLDQGIYDFSVMEPVQCCELVESDLLTVNGQPWGASYFDRKATAPWCTPGQETPTPTPTVTETPVESVTPTPTETPVESATPTPTPTETETFTPTPTVTRTPSRTATRTFTPTLTPSFTPTATPTNTLTPSATPSVCGWGSLGRPEDKDPYTATIVRVGGAVTMEWWSPGGNHTNWTRLVGDGGKVKFWSDRLNPATSRVWIEVYVDPTRPPIMRQECYTLSQCWLHTRRDQIYYIRGQILTDTGCTRWNFDDP